MAAVAGATYLDNLELEPLLESWGFTDFNSFDSPTIQGYLANGEGFTIVAFRGSDYAGVDDWVNNTDFDLVFDANIRGGQIHAGFQRAAESIWSQLQQLLKDYRRTGDQLILTGHSLGGALAMLTAARFASESRSDEVDAIYTFGQPRAGDRDFARRFDRDFGERAYRFVNHFDLVTRLPPRMLGYGHAGQLRFLDEDGVLHESPSLWQQLLLTLDPKGKNARDYIGELTEKLPGAVNDHNNLVYTNRLKDLCPAARKP